MSALRDRDARLGRFVLAASILVPGTAGLLARRPVAGLVGALAAAFAATAVLCRDVVVDPLAAGAMGPVAFGLAAAFALLVYAGTIAQSIRFRPGAR
jgi:hypothetical protein